MSGREAFDEWAAEGRDRGMEDRHWQAAKRILARIPVDAGDDVLDVGTGSGYAARALRAAGARLAIGVDASLGMARNARSYTDDPAVGFVIGDIEHLPIADGSVDHVFSMEALYYAPHPRQALSEIRRVLRSGGTFYCAVDYYEENEYSHDWPSSVDIAMTLWSADEYRDAFSDAGFHVASQENVAYDIDIPPADAFPTEGFENRAAMVERYRELGSLLTVGVAP